MKIYRNILICTLLVLTLVISGCKEDPPKQKVQNTSLVFDWFTSLTFSGEVSGLYMFADSNKLNLKLSSGNETTDPIKLVISGQYDFGVVSAEKFMSAIEKGADLVAIGCVNPINPTVFISKKSQNITKPKDFENHTIGILPGGSTEFVYRALVKEQGVDKSKLKEITVPFDLNTFISDKYDVRPAFIYDEPVFLNSQGIDVNIIEPKNYGVSFFGRVYFCEAKLIKNNPELVAAFIKTMAEGWEYALSNPEKAIENLKKFDNQINYDKELAALKIGINYFKSKNGKVLILDSANWKSTNDILINLGFLTKEIQAEKYLNNTFIEKYYK